MRGFFLRICSVVRFFWGRDYYAIWVLPRSSSSSVILLSSSGEARGGVAALCLTKKTVSNGQDFRFGIGSLLCRFSAKKRPISFALYPQINPTARFDGGQNGGRRLCKTSFTAVLCRLHIVRTNCIYPCEAAAFCPHPDVFLTAVLLTVDIFLKIEYHICDDMPSAVSDNMRQTAL